MPKQYRIVVRVLCCCSHKVLCLSLQQYHNNIYNIIHYNIILFLRIYKIDASTLSGIPVLLDLLVPQMGQKGKCMDRFSPELAIEPLLDDCFSPQVRIANLTQENEQLQRESSVTI